MTEKILQTMELLVLRGKFMVSFPKPITLLGNNIWIKMV